MKNLLRVGVIGGGSFGTALATAAARCGHEVRIFSQNEKTINEINNYHKNTRIFPDDIKIPENVSAYNDAEYVLKDADIVIHAIPVQVSYEFIEKHSELIRENTPYVIASKGMLLKQKKFFSQVWDDLFPKRAVPHCILSGPSFAVEIMKNFPTLVTLGCVDEKVGTFVRDSLSSESFRIYTTTDVIGVEIGGALKNPLAIAAGLIEGLGYKYNTISALITRGVFEISLFSKKFGGKTETLYGLSGNILLIFRYW